jgi:hypothetical protein
MMATTTTGYPSWTYAFLQSIGAPATSNNLYALQQWSLSEDPTGSYLSARNNPLATTDFSGSNGYVLSNDGTTKIPTFPTLAAGAAAFAHTLSNGANGYSGIVSAFQSGTTSLSQIYQAINNSDWCRGCNGGQYPPTLAASVNKTPAPGNFGGSTGSTTALASDVSGQSGSSQGSSGNDPCIIGEGGLLGIGAVCFMNHSQAKAFVAGMLIAVGGVTMGLGVILIVAFGLAGSGAGRGALAVSSRLPGPIGGASRGLKSLGSGKTAPAKPKVKTVTKTEKPSKEEIDKLVQEKYDKEFDEQEAEAKKQEAENEKLARGEKSVKGEKSAPSPFADQEGSLRARAKAARGNAANRAA